MSTEVPKGSVAAGNRVRLPAGAEPPIEVYVNGVRQAEGDDYRLEGGGGGVGGGGGGGGAAEIVFARPIVKERVSGARWLAMLLGLFGSYGRNDVVDVEYRRGGRVELVSDAEVLPG